MREAAKVPPRLLRDIPQFFNKIDLDEYLESLTKETEKDGVNTELEMLQNALELSNIKMRECMVPRADLTAININSSIFIISFYRFLIGSLFTHHIQKDMKSISYASSGLPLICVRKSFNS